MRAQHKVIVLSMVLGVVAWVADAVLDFLVFYKPVSFWDVLILDVPAHEVYGRLVAIVLLTGFGTLTSRVLARRERAEEALDEAAQRWQYTFDAIDDMVAILDTDFRVVRANRAMRQAFGGAKVIGAHCWELVHGTEDPPPDCGLPPLAVPPTVS